MNTRTPRDSKGQFYSWNDVNSESRNQGTYLPFQMMLSDYDKKNK